MSGIHGFAREHAHRRNGLEVEFPDADVPKAGIDHFLRQLPPEGVCVTSRSAAIAIMHHEPIRLVARQEASELLRGPLGGRPSSQGEQLRRQIELDSRQK
jgi:hypothetical protein